MATCCALFDVCLQKEHHTFLIRPTGCVQTLLQKAPLLQHQGNQNLAKTHNKRRACKMTSDGTEGAAQARLKQIESKIGLYPDFPKRGILFRDIMPVFGDPQMFECLIDALAERVKHLKFERILGIESRGFLIGPSLAHKLRLPFGPIRKKGKLPGELFSVEYELEYGRDVLEVQKDGLPQGSKCLVVDDLIATGGSMEASKRLIELSGSQVVAFLVIIELAALKGSEKLGGLPLISLFSY